MPISKSFKDLSITFDKHPVTDDLLVTKNEAAIRGSIYNLILTKPGERFFNPNIGCSVSNLLFEPLNFITAGSISREIEYTIKAFEPRVRLQDVEVEIDEYNNGFDVIISYIIVGVPENTQNLNFFLGSTAA